MFNKIIVVMIIIGVIAIAGAMAFKYYYSEEYVLLKMAENQKVDLSKPQSILVNISPVSRQKAEAAAEKFKGMPGVEVFVKEMFITQYMPNDWQCLVRRQIKPDVFELHAWRKEAESKVGPVFSLQWENIHRSLLD